MEPLYKGEDLYSKCFTVSVITLVPDCMVCEVNVKPCLDAWFVISHL